MTNLGGHSHNRRLTFQPEPKNVSRCVDIAIVRLPAFGTVPDSYSKCAHTFRAASGNSPAARTHLGSKSLADFGEQCSCLLAFVREHVPETRPASVRNGFSHPSSLELGRIYIANDDVSIAPYKFRRLLVQVIFSSVCDLSVKHPDATFVAGALSYRQRRLVLCEVSWVLNCAAVTERGERFQAKIDSDSLSLLLSRLLNFALNDEVPAASRIFDKAGGFHLSFNCTRLPEPECALKNRDGAIADFYRSTLKRNPSESATFAKAGPKARVAPMLVSGGRKSPANQADRIGQNPKLARRSKGQFIQIEMRRPESPTSTCAAALSFFLRIDAVVPNLIARTSHAAEMPLRAGVFHPEFERDDHERIL